MQKQSTADTATAATEQTTATSQQAQHLLELLSHFDTVMMITREGKRLGARPMTIAEREPSGRIWLLTSIDAERTRALEFAPRVHLTCQSARVYLSFAGHAQVTRDRAKLDQLWKESYRLWFPEGKSAPDLALISVDLLEGEYWDQSGLKALRFLFDAAKAYVTGEEIDVSPDSHAKAVLAEKTHSA